MSEHLYATLDMSEFLLGIHYADSSSLGVVSYPPPAETSADVASPCFDQTGRVLAVLHTQVLWQRQLRKGRSRQQGGLSAARGDQVWLRYLVRGDHFEGGLSTA